MNDTPAGALPDRGTGPADNGTGSKKLLGGGSVTRLPRIGLVPDPPEMIGRPSLSCVKVVAVPVNGGCADVRRASVTEVPQRARVRLDCGDATWFDPSMVELLAEALRPASAVQVIGSSNDLVLGLHNALSAAWTSRPDVQGCATSPWDGDVSND